MGRQGHSGRDCSPVVAAEGRAIIIVGLAIVKLAGSPPAVRRQSREDLSPRSHVHRWPNQPHFKARRHLLPSLASFALVERGK